MPKDVEPTGTQDQARLASLASYDILDTPSEVGFDDVVTLATHVCEAPVALVSLVDRDRQWFKARIGFGPQQTPLSQSVCRFALDRSELLVIPDLTQDERTRTNSLVTGAPNLRFYAGAPLVAPSGHVLGSICVLDHAARPGGLTDRQAEGLQALARQVMQQLEMRRMLAERDAVGRQKHEIDQRFRQIEGRLETADERLQIALAASGVVGLWDWNVASDRLHGDANFARLYGLDVARTADGLTMEEYQEFVVPDDLVDLRTRIRDTFERGADFLVEYRLAIPGQPMRWVECKGRMIYGEGGRAERFSGSAIDVTHRKHVENEIRRLADIVEHSGDFIGVARLDGSVEWVNQSGRRLVGLTDEASARQTTIEDYFDPAQWSRIAAEVFPAVNETGHWS